MKQNDCIIIGLTGGIGTGKSTVTNILLQLGYKVIDADGIARMVVEIGKPAYNDIVEIFGLRILLEDKNLNRKKLGRLIFNNSVLRNALNKIVHPRVFEEIKKVVEDECINNKIIFVDMPLLFEVFDQLGNYNLNFDEIWMVYTDENTQLSRLMERDNILKDEAITKINSQLNVNDKRKKATKILYNNGDLIELKSNLMKMLHDLNQ